MKVSFSLKSRFLGTTQIISRDVQTISIVDLRKPQIKCWYITRINTVKSTYKCVVLVSIFCLVNGPLIGHLQRLWIAGLVYKWSLHASKLNGGPRLLLINLCVIIPPIQPSSFSIRESRPIFVEYCVFCSFYFISVLKGIVAQVYVGRPEGGMGGWISLEEYLRIDCYSNC